MSDDRDPSKVDAMNSYGFSFGIILVPRTATEWSEQVRRAELQGYASVLLPDTTFTPSPFPALAAAAAVTTTIKLRPWVLAAPLRHPAVTAREVSALQLLSDGRLELGIGAGRPDAQREADKFGMPWGMPTRRRQQVRETVETVRATIDPAPPVIVAAGGPRLLADAAEYADRISLAAQPQASADDLAPMVEIVRATGAVPISYQLVGIGDRLPYVTATKFGHTPDSLRQAGAAGMLSGEPDAAAKELIELRDRFGIDELLVPGELADDFVPVLQRLCT